jgi:hypothetical protein
MSKGSAPTLQVDWSGEDLVMTVKGTPASAKATRARVRLEKSVLLTRNREAMTESMLDLLAEAFPFLTVRTRTE